MNTNKFIASCGDVKVGLFLIDEKGVRDPDILDELRTHGEGLYTLPLVEGKSWISPKLPEVKIQCKVLEKHKTQSIPRIHTNISTTSSFRR